MSRRGASWIERLDRWQRRRRRVGFVVAVAKRYSEDGAARHGARIAYYAFFSVFPLMLAFVSILGFALEDDAALRQTILESAYADMPVIGPFIRSDIDAIGGSGIALAVGIAVALWAGLGVTVALGQALDHVWNVPPVEQLSWVGRRLRGLATLAVGGLGLIASSALGGLATSGELRPATATAASLVVSFAVDAVILLGGFRLLASALVRVRELLPGVVAGAVGLFVLQALGGWYVNRAIGRATDTYGLFATVIGLLSWLSLAAQVVLIAAEIAAVRTLALWPRSLTGPMTDADRRAIEGYAHAALRDQRAEIITRWPRPDSSGRGDAPAADARDDRP